ncbi:MAG: ATP-binding protein [Pseudomonadota bacterium]|uniref:sensor histidine kinase n=1 Tax=unclassified Phenylobacterium TaxID=2640670 RepID=UPI0006FF447D|nr:MULTISPECIES: PAS domain-containing sensor histidine kinase [unclassified Phenylobacterium]KRB51130.1 histidine kinase [Phenylobacterium sp. Root700]MBT9471542.1 PAS-domain containing protein [Phenylobacterium sp.]
MSEQQLILGAAAGAVLLALCAMAWLVDQRRRNDARMDVLNARIAELEVGAEASQASAEAFDSALLSVQDGHAMLASGEESLALCAEALGLSHTDPQAVVSALMRADPDHARRLRALFERGEACAFDVQGAGGLVAVEGRAAGALAWLRLSAVMGEEVGLPTAPRFAAFLDARRSPAWIAAADGSPVWVNAAWLTAAGVATLDEAAALGASFDKNADSLASEAANLGLRRETLRWTTFGGRRRAFQVIAQPLEGGGVGVWTEDLTETEELREALKRHVEAHDETLNHIADAVAIFGEGKRLIFHNTAFAELWSLEPAWLAERPTHGEILDRLRQRRRLPETVDYAKWKAAELDRYEDTASGPDDLWSLPEGRTLKVGRQPHPMGGVVLLFSDITGELRLKAQYNAQIQVQQATLDKLNDAVAVFGSDGRLRLHNEAFERFWNITDAQLEQAHDFEGVVDLCVPRLHDMGFWRELKGRVADPDPQARAPISGEVKTSDSRIVVYQSRPLPDGATLIAFGDVTDARKLERALADRSAALAEAERLKRDFVGNVSYELRTPLTTIIGYSELLERSGENLSERGRGHAAAVRTAATQLARSIDDVLDMAQIDADEMALDLEDVHVAELLTQSAERWAKDAEAAGVTIKVEHPDDIGLIRGDIKRLTQTLDHLTENAVRQTPAGGLVTIAARRALGEIQLQVTDTGRGIPFHVQAHIFDRFIGRERGGPGLGLALVKALVELHGGWVALESEPGAGATFTCHLPEAAQGAAGHPELSF